MLPNPPPQSPPGHALSLRPTRKKERHHDPNPLISPQALCAIKNRERRRGGGEAHVSPDACGEGWSARSWADRRRRGKPNPSQRTSFLSLSRLPSDPPPLTPNAFRHAGRGKTRGSSPRSTGTPRATSGWRQQESARVVELSPSALATAAAVVAAVSPGLAQPVLRRRKLEWKGGRPYRGGR